MVFSVPHLSEWLERKYTNCINFEHSILLTEPYIEYLLAKHGFRVVDKRHVMDGHSIFYATVRDSAVMPCALPAGLYDFNRRLYERFVSYHEQLVADLNARMAAHDGPVHLFGAHIFSQYLLGFGLNPSPIEDILDNDARKHDKRLYGTPLRVRSPKVLRGQARPAVVLKAGIYNEEIKADILANINPDTVFFE
jgi:hypothetical protein